MPFRSVPCQPSFCCVGSVPCACSSIDLSDLFARRANVKEAGVPKDAEGLVQLLARCTNPGARGWDTVLQSALETSGVRMLLHEMIKICLTGMHPQLHPSMRPAWQSRMCILRVAQPLLSDRQDLVKAACQVKDAVRRALASMFACDAASHAALAVSDGAPSPPVTWATSPGGSRSDRCRTVAQRSNRGSRLRASEIHISRPARWLSLNWYSSITMAQRASWPAVPECSPRFASRK